MRGESVGSHDDLFAELYPDVVEAGGLVAAIDERARRLGTPLEGVVPGGRSSGERAAAINSPTGYLAVMAEHTTRSFFVRIRDRGVELAGGSTELLDDVVRAAFAWQSGRGLRDMHEVAPFMLFDELAEAHERGDAVAVKWRMLRDAEDERISALAAAVESVPEVAALFPFVSHNVLCLSRVTGYPYTSDAPYVNPYSTPGPSYQVFSGDSARLVADTESPQEALRAVARELPEGYGPARPGTALDPE